VPDRLGEPPDDLASAVRLFGAPARQRLEARRDAINRAAPIADATLIEFVTRLELADFLPLGCANRVVQLVTRDHG
jgi:hypothetical protein